MITQKMLKDLIVYDSATGIFVWRHRKESEEGNANARRFNAKYAGEIAGSTFHVRGGVYRRIRIHKVGYLSHRLAWLYVYGVFPVDQIDHIDRNGCNNSIENLRAATQFENMQNMVKAKNLNRQGFPGIRFIESANKYISVITVHRKKLHLGTFDTKVAAFDAYLDAKARLHPYWMAKQLNSQNKEGM